MTLGAASPAFAGRSASPFAGASDQGGPDAARSSSAEVAIVVPYEGATRLTPYWAIEEERIDWQKDDAGAERCTVAFAATELRKYLALAFPKTKFQFHETMPLAVPCIIVGPRQRVAPVFTPASGLAPLRDRQSYLKKSAESSGQTCLVLAGGGREGTLYAVYAFLQALGWRWYAPGEAGELPPEGRPALRLDGFDVQESPDFPFFRGFHAYPPSMESRDLFLWMARNRLNLWAYKANSYAFMKKLGFRLMTGGHILEEILDPDKPQP